MCSAGLLGDETVAHGAWEEELLDMREVPQWNWGQGHLIRGEGLYGTGGGDSES